MTHMERLECLREHCAAVNRNASKIAVPERVQQAATGIKHDNAEVFSVRYDKLVVSDRASHAAGPTQLTGANIAHKHAVHCKYADAVVDVVGDCDVVEFARKAQSARTVQHTVAAAY
jgi:hypothetical protein